MCNYPHLADDHSPDDWNTAMTMPSECPSLDLPFLRLQDEGHDIPAAVLGRQMLK